MKTALVWAAVSVTWVLAACGGEVASNPRDPAEPVAPGGGGDDRAATGGSGGSGASAFDPGFGGHAGATFSATFTDASVDANMAETEPTACCEGVRQWESGATVLLQASNDDAAGCGFSIAFSYIGSEVSPGHYTLAAGQLDYMETCLTSPEYRQWKSVSGAYEVVTNGPLNELVITDALMVPSDNPDNLAAGSFSFDGSGHDLVLEGIK